jgi:hypothetical protein
MTPRKGIKGGAGGSVELLSISDGQWSRIVAELPNELPEDIEANLRERVIRCCNRYLARRRVWLRDVVTFAAMQAEPGKRAPFEKLVAGLQMAAAAWAQITDVYYAHRLGGRPQPDSVAINASDETVSPDAAAQFGGVFHDNRLGDASKYVELTEMVRGAERQLQGLRDLGEAVGVVNPWDDFVRDLRSAAQAVGLPPVTASGAIYEETGTATWFQKFAVAVDENLVGERRLVERPRGLNATYAAIAAALAESPSEG